LSLVCFFRAEDGIRDDLVTGVQTCALPISAAATGIVADQVATVVPWSAAVPVAAAAAAQLAQEGIAVDLLDLRTVWPWDEAAVRSEERRVGKGCVERRRRETERRGEKRRCT